MSPSRRSLLLGAAGTAALIAGKNRGLPTEMPVPPETGGFDPWLEIDPSALAHNVAAVSRLTGGRSVLAVVKNNAYGLGLDVAGPILDRLAGIAGFAVVKAQEALRLRQAGVRKPVLLMGRCGDEEAQALVRRGVRLAAVGEDDPARLGRIAARAGQQIGVHLYVDTGMGRMGYPWRRAVPWGEALAKTPRLKIEGCFTELTEDPEFDSEQVRRLSGLAAGLRAAGVAAGPLHAASSAAVMHQPDTFLDLVRPGLALFGGYPTKESMARAELRCAVRLRARVVRVERVETGEGVSYHRRWRADRPTWVATLPLGHVDGYPSGAVKGAEVLVGDRLYKVVGTVSASHTVIEVGDEATVQVGDTATLVGPDRPAIHPNVVAERAGYSEYDMFMHLSPLIPRTVLSGP